MEIQTSSRVAEIQIMGGEQPVTLGSNVSNLQHQIACEFALNIEVILRRVLSAHLGLELSKKQDWAEHGPVHRLPARRIENSVERIGDRSSVLQFERGIEQTIGDTGTASEWRLRAELFQH